MSGSISNEGHESWRFDISGYGVQVYIFACGWRQRLSCWHFILQLLPALAVEGDLMLVFSLDDLSLKAFDRCRSFDFFLSSPFPWWGMPYTATDSDIEI